MGGQHSEISKRPRENVHDVSSAVKYDETQLQSTLGLQAWTFFPQGSLSNLSSSPDEREPNYCPIWRVTISILNFPLLQTQHGVASRPSLSNKNLQMKK